MATAVLVASGFTVSSAFELTRARFAVHLVNSLIAGTQVRVAFAQTLDATSAQFGVLQAENSAAPYLVFSAGMAVVSQPIPAITPYARLVTTGALGGPSSYTVLPLTQ
jgi:hypothetical protein